MPNNYSLNFAAACVYRAKLLCLAVIILGLAFVLGGCNSEPKLGDIQERSNDGMILVYVPGGDFVMGSSEAEIEAAFDLCMEYPEAHCFKRFLNNQLPQHPVALDAFWIDRTEISNAQYQKCVEAGNCRAPTPCELGELTYGDPAQADHPVVCVNWYDAEAYCQWAGGRLPTEAEWEYAARGSESSLYPWGDEFDGARLNYCDRNCDNPWADTAVDDGFTFTAPGGTYPEGASWCGAMDLAGNVFEWTADWIASYPENDDEGQPALNPTGPETGSKKVLRGGTWYYDPTRALSATRDSVVPDNSFGFLGFRCVVPVGD